MEHRSTCSWFTFLCHKPDTNNCKTVRDVLANCILSLSLQRALRMSFVCPDVGCWWHLARCRSAAGAWQVVVPHSGRRHQTNKPKGKHTMLIDVLTIYDQCKPRWYQLESTESIDQRWRLKMFLNEFWFRLISPISTGFGHLGTQGWHLWLDMGTLWAIDRGHCRWYGEPLGGASCRYGSLSAVILRYFE